MRKNCETEFRHSRCTDRLQFCGRKVAKNVTWKAERKWKAKGWGVTFRGRRRRKIFDPVV